MCIAHREESARKQGQEASDMPLALDRPETAAASQATLSITSSAFAAGQRIPPRFSNYGDNVSPQLKLKGLPAGAKSIAVIVEDPDAKGAKPYVHWLLYNVPPTATDVHELIPPEPRLPDLGGALQGMNSDDDIGYFGPRPPKGDPPHHYHFEVFALDRTLDLGPGVDREKLLTAMKGHVLARGGLEGVFEAP
jgi:Raf kinase inhibitor-like YbhB/YbcL family protein